MPRAVKSGAKARRKQRPKTLIVPSRAKSLTPRDRATAGLILDLLTNEIHRLKGALGRGMYEVGVRLARIVDERLWAGRGYQSFEHYLEEGVSFSRSTGYKLIRIAREFDAELAERYGVEKLELGLRYLESTPVPDRPRDLVTTDLRLRDATGRFRSVSFHEATPSQIREAISLVAETKAKPRRLPQRWQRKADQLSANLPPPPPGVHKGERVRLKRGLDGRLAVTFNAIALDDLPSFIAECERIFLWDTRKP